MLSLTTCHPDTRSGTLGWALQVCAECGSGVRSGNSPQCSDPVTHPQHQSLGCSLGIGSCPWYRFLRLSEPETPLVWEGGLAQAAGGLERAMCLSSSSSRGAESPSTPDSLRHSLRGDLSTQGGVPGPRRAHGASQPGREHPGTSGQGGRKRQAQEGKSGGGRVGLWNFRKVGGSGGGEGREEAEPSPAPSEAL